MNAKELSQIDLALRSKPKSPTVTLTDEELRELYYLALRPVGSKHATKVLNWVLFECKTFRPTTDAIHDFCQSLDGKSNAHLGAEEAWALLAWDDADTTVVTNEIAEAQSVCRGIYLDGDKIAARMAFKEAYTRIAAQAKASGKEPTWFASLGTDKEGQIGPLRDAVAKGRISPAFAETHAPQMIPGRTERKAIAGETGFVPMPDKIREQMQRIGLKIA